MSIIPWRVKNFLSVQFPLAYHFAVNLGVRGNDAAHWDKRLAETWDARDWPTKTALIASLTKPNDKILDIGCGSGSILRSLKSQGYTDLHGLEISNYAVERLRSEGLTMYQGSLPRLPLPECQFDVVIASQVLEHIIRRRLFLNEIRRVLKPGGRAFIFVPNNCLGPIDEPEHVVCFNNESFTKELARHFDVASIEVMHDVNYQISLLFGHVKRPDLIH
ncbi:MAG: class I SAM-dependent methyltransferase [Pseudomonadota bacterium]